MFAILDTGIVYIDSLVAVRGGICEDENFEQSMSFRFNLYYYYKSQDYAHKVDSVKVSLHYFYVVNSDKNQTKQEEKVAKI